ncbi:MAG: DUF6884 domain-containing protein [Promethearchaeia archaeon]
MAKKDKRVIITGCTKTKLDHAAPAIELNQGQLFKMVKRLAEKNNFDIKILSGKHGLLDPHQVIEPYDQKIRTQADIQRIRKHHHIYKRVKEIWRTYEDIIVIMGKKYRQVIEPYYDSKFIVLNHPKGYFGYLSLFSHYNKITKDQFSKEIERFRVAGCAEYLKSYWDFQWPYPHYTHYHPSYPHSCNTCTYFEKEKCTFEEQFLSRLEIYRENMKATGDVMEDYNLTETIPNKFPKNKTLIKWLEG